ncbi:MAG: hypothetical protein ACQRW7_13445 [Caulobacterales bacterium]|uniref:hypothetical protein n=1 Tax=Glycocaulis sp. TaxID=1969725 RepID=UPI003FA0C368
MNTPDNASARQTSQSWRAGGALVGLFLVSSALLYLGAVAAFLLLDAPSMAFAFTGPAAVLMIMAAVERRMLKATQQQPAGSSS